MCLDNLLEKYSRYFYFIGLSVFDPTKNHNRMNKPHQRWTHFIFHYIYIAITVFLIILCWVVSYTLPFNALSVILGIVFWLSNLMSVISIVENYYFIDSLPLAQQHFRQIHLLFDKYRHEFASPITYQSFEKRYQKHSLLLLSILFIHISTSMFFPENSQYYSFIVPLLILEAIGKLITLHVLFYVDLLFYIMKCFNAFIDTFDVNETISTHQSMYDSNAMLISQLHLFKLVHHKLWTISKIITNRFGWTTIIISGKTFVVLTYSVFFVFVRVEEKNSYTLIVRKYLCNSII